jgi:hypothetical protein
MLFSCVYCFYTVLDTISLNPATYGRLRAILIKEYGMGLVLQAIFIPE